jgi:hypothetical protein
MDGLTTVLLPCSDVKTIVIIFTSEQGKIPFFNRFPHCACEKLVILLKCVLWPWRLRKIAFVSLDTEIFYSCENSCKRIYASYYLQEKII